MTNTTRRELRPEVNPFKGRLEIAVYIDGTHCGYAESYRAADALAAEIVAKREQAERATMAAYIAPRPTPRKTKVRSACKCPLCTKSTPEDGVQYCRAGREYIAWYGGLMHGGGTYLEATKALQDTIYAQLTHSHASISDLDPEAAAEVLAARDVAA